MAKKDDEAGAPQRYRAPALDKGLDILELLASEPLPMTLTAIVNRLERSHGELFRMVQVLEYRGYIEQDRASDGYRLTDQLFSLGMQQPRIQNLVEIALPIMRQLTIEVEQSCHLAVHARGQMAVIARMESSEQLGFSVRVGYRRALHESASGAVLYAFQPPDIQERWERLLDPPLPKAALEAFRVHTRAIAKRQVELTPSRFVAGITDISAPVMRGGAAAAALTVPYIRKVLPSATPDETATAVRAAANRISTQLTEGDNRI